MSTATTAEDKQPIPNQVFVGGMTPETTVQELTKHFESLKLSPVGAPTFFTTPEGVSKGCALVPFASPEAVTAAIEALSGSTLHEQELTAREDRGPRKRREPNHDASFLYVGNLDPTVTGEELQPLFDPHGEVKACLVIRRRRNVDNPVGWASVQYATEEEAKAAQAALHGHEFKGHALTVEMLRSMPRPPRKARARQRQRASENQGEAAPEQPTPDPCVVWVGNVPWTTTEDTLRGIFAAHGAVKDVTITRDKRSKESRGWGTVTYENAEDAATAIEKLPGTKIEDREINVQLRRGPRRRNRPPAQEAGEQTTAETDEKKTRPRRRPRNLRRPRRRQQEQPAEAPAEETKTATKKTRARPRRRNDSQRNEQTEEAPVTVHVGESAEEEGKKNRRRRRRRKPEGGNDAEQTAEPPARERRETERVVDNPDCHLYVRNVPFKATAEELQAFFEEKAGHVVSAAITITKKGMSRGWGTVEMGSPEAAQKALELDKELFQDRPLVVRIDKRVRGGED